MESRSRETSIPCRAKESFSLVPLFPERSSEPGKHSEMAEVDCTNTLEGLEESPVRCPPADSRLLGTYMAYLLRTGYFDPPPRREVRSATEAR